MLSRLFLGLFATMLAACGPQQTNEPHNSAPENAGIADFYHGKKVWIMVGFPAGGGYDTAARVLARHIQQHIPGKPDVLVQNMPGAGGMVAANHVYNLAPKDGTILGIFSDMVPIAPLWKIEGARYDPLAINWLGSLTDNGAAVVLVRADAPATDLKGARQTELLLGAGGAGNVAATHPKLLNELIGTKFRPVLGYPGNSDITLAIQRGELHGVADKDWRTLAREHPEWLEQNFVVPLLLLTTEPQPALPDVPLAINYAKDETDRAIMRLAFGIHEYARAFSMASGVPEDRVAAMRAAFESTVVEPDFVTEAETQLGQTLAVKTGEEIAAFVRDAYALPEEVQERVARYAAVE